MYSQVDREFSNLDSKIGTFLAVSEAVKKLYKGFLVRGVIKDNRTIETERNHKQQTSSQQVLHVQIR